MNNENYAHSTYRIFTALQNHARIFEEPYRTKEEGSGNSLMDAICAAWEERMEKEQEQGLAHISIGTKEIVVNFSDAKAVGMFITEHGRLPEKDDLEGVEFVEG